MIYIVLGMHKSGTTLISQILNNSGISMVDYQKEDLSYDRGNKYERESTKFINHEILNSEGVFSLDIQSPQKLEIRVEQKNKIQAIIRENEKEHESWGFKDPRECLTYPVWLPELPEHKIIVIYRSPSEIWQRYSKSRRKYNTSSFAKIKGAWDFMRSWCQHNQSIINSLNGSEMEILILNYSNFMSEKLEFNRLEEFVGVELNDCRDIGLYRNKKAKKNRYLLDFFCFIKTMKTPEMIARQLESLNS